MSTRDDIPEGKESLARAGLAGAGGGTLLAVIASTLPDSHPLKPWMFWLAPYAAVLLSAVWIWTQRKIATHFREREVRDLVDRAKATLLTALKDPDTSEEHRKRLRSQLEELELLAVSRFVDRIRSLKMIDSLDIQAADSPAQGGTSGTSAAD